MSKNRNLIPFPYYGTSKTKNDLTFTVRDDGGVAVTGTASATTEFELIAAYDVPITLAVGVPYTLSGGGNGVNLLARKRLASGSTYSWLEVHFLLQCMKVK